MSSTLLLMGGGHAHMTVMAELSAYTSRGYRVILVNPDAYHYYSGMGPGLLGGTYRPQETRFHIRKMVEDRGGEFVRGRVASIDPQRREVTLEDGQNLPFDVASCNTGSGVVMPPGGDHEALTGAKPIAGLLALKSRLEARLKDKFLKLIVVGGGPAGVELAGNLRQLVDRAGGEASIALMSGHHGLLPSFPRSMQQRARAHLSRRGIDLVEEGRVVALDKGFSCMESGVQFSYDHAVIATGVQPPPLFRRSGMSLGTCGGMKVNAFLQSIDSPVIFGGGDCIHFSPHPLAKVGVYAVRQNPVLHHNLLAALEGRPLKKFDPQGDYLLILNLGEGEGLLRKGRVVIEGRRAFAAKDWIDRRFMRTFQLSGELDD